MKNTAHQRLATGDDVQCMTSTAADDAAADDDHHQRLHVVFFAFPLAGHFYPALSLAKTLHRMDGISSVTFVSARYRVSSFQESARDDRDFNHLLSSPSFQIVGFSEEAERRPSHSMGEQPDSVPGGLNWAWRSVCKMRKSLEDLIRELMSRAGRSPLCIVSDDFAAWTREVAVKFQLRWYAFHPSSASYLALLFYLPTILSRHRIPIDMDHAAVTKYSEITEPFFIPGIGVMKIAELPDVLQDGCPMEVLKEFSVTYVDHLHKADGVLVNTHEVLNQLALHALRTCLDLNPNMVEVFPIGPCLQPVSGSHANTDPGLEEALSWLDSQQPSSVLYVCFGSLFVQSSKQIQELALGLEASRQPFFWVLRSPSSSDHLSQILPPQFLSRVQEQGRVVSGWVPQLQILSHPSVGGFLSHCGWNSILEGIVMGGVRFLAFPQMYDQRIQAKLLTEELKVGVMLEKKKGSSDEDGDGEKVAERDDIERAVRSLMMHEDGEMRSAKEVQGAVVMSRESRDGGYCMKSLKAFIKSASSPIQ